MIFFIEIVNDPEYPVIDNKYSLSELQARSILEIRLSKLTGLERMKISDDLEECNKLIKSYLKILSSSTELNRVLTDGLKKIKDNLSQQRRTEISESEEIIDDESLISSEEMVVTVTHTGYSGSFIISIKLETFTTLHFFSKSFVLASDVSFEFLINVIISSIFSKAIAKPQRI